jgi:hypothetical protein
MAMVATAGAGSAAQLAPNWSENTSSSAAQPLPTGKSALGTFPMDATTSHNNNRAAVRFANPNDPSTVPGANGVVIGMWNLLDPGVTPNDPIGTIGGGSMLSGEYISLGGNPFSTYQPSDLIQITNSTGVSIGAGRRNAAAEQNESYVEVFTFNPLTLDIQYVEGTAPTDPNYAAIRAGHTHDVAITRDGEWAVVNADNWIHVIDLTPPSSGPQFYAFNIGGLDFSNPVAGPQIWNRPCTPNYSVDSVEVTNDRAVVTTSRERLPAGSNVFTTWVYIIDFHDPFASLGQSGPGIVLQHEIPSIPAGQQFPTELGDWPHDLAISPGADVEPGSAVRAVVTTMHTVAAYDLSTNTFLNAFTDLDDRRQYQWQVDSVEMTGKMAVVISDKATATAGLQWRVKFFELAASGLVASVLHESSSEVEDRAHDIIIARDYDRGLVRTSFNNVLLQNISSPPPLPTTVASPNGSNAHAYDQFSLATGLSVFSSDSVAIGTQMDDNGTQRLLAVSIGGRLSLSGTWDTRVDLVDLNASPATALIGQQVVTPVLGASEGCIPIDVAFAYGNSEVVVRSADPRPESAGADGPDLARIKVFPTASFAVLQRNGGNGVPFSVDAIATQPLGGLVNTTRRILSVAKDEFSFLDFIHIVR